MMLWLLKGNGSCHNIFHFCENFLSCSSAPLLRLFHLVLETTHLVFKVLLFDRSECTQNDQFQDKVGEWAKNDEVMHSSLDFTHLSRPPVGHPVNEPEEIAKECNCDQQHELQLVVIILIPHHVQEGIEWQIVIGAAEACKRTEDTSGKEHTMQMSLCTGQQLSNFHLRVLSCGRHRITYLFQIIYLLLISI